MTIQRTRVALIRESDRKSAIYGALDAVRSDVAAKVRDQVMLKPNFLTSKNQLASSHVDAMRGIIDFLLALPNPPREIIIAEGGNEDYSGQAFDNFGYRQLVDSYPIPVRLIDLNQEERWSETPVILADGSDSSVRMPDIVLECPCTFSVAIAKTHDVCVVTLALKNMIMGTIHKQDRVLMHGYRTHAERQLPTEAKVLNINLLRLAQHLQPDVAVIDGVEGLQGNGPMGTDAVDLGIAVAGADVYAADAVMTAAMGFDPAAMGTLQYGSLLRKGVIDLSAIEIIGTPIEEVRQQFVPHESTDLQLQWQRDDALTLLPI